MSLFISAIDGKWGKWKGAGKCKSNKKKGCTKTFTRKCDKPKPKHGGKKCKGKKKKKKKCKQTKCRK